MGSFEGGLGRLELRGTAGLWQRTSRLKRWLYLGLVTERHYIGLAVVRLGYLASTFAFVLERGKAGLVVDRAAFATPRSIDFEDTMGEGAKVAIAARGAEVSFRRAASGSFQLEARFHGLRVSAELDPRVAPPAIGAVVPTERGLFTTTEKRALLGLRGEASVLGARVPLDGGLAGYDFTVGYPPRHTSWKWAFALGWVQGAPLALNLVEGFVGSAECAAWFDGQLFGLSEGRFRFDLARPLDPWDVSTEAGEVALDFAPSGVHEERVNFGLMRTKFIQTAGLYGGSVTLGDRKLTIDSMLGVSEDQDSFW